MLEREGIIVAVCKSSERAYPKFPQERVYVSDRGIDGDAHATRFRRSFRNPLFFKPNDREISIVSDEVRQELNEKFGLGMEPGHFNENLLISGIGDLSNYMGGERITFQSGVELVVVEQNKPCAKLSFFNRKDLKDELINDDETVNRRGLVAIVTQTGYLSPGDTFLIHNRKYPRIGI
jgi:hypothetical protein